MAVNKRGIVMSLLAERGDGDVVYYLVCRFALLDALNERFDVGQDALDDFGYPRRPSDGDRPAAWNALSSATPSRKNG